MMYEPFIIVIGVAGFTVALIASLRRLSYMSRGWSRHLHHECGWFDIVGVDRLIGSDTKLCPGCGKYDNKWEYKVGRAKFFGWEWQ